MERGQSFQQMVLKQLDIHRPKLNLNLHLILFSKINVEWIIHLIVKHKTVKILENHAEEHL